MPKKYNNQKVIVVNKEKSNKENKYAIFNMISLKTAMKELSPNAFVLWSYINKNQNGYEFALSPKDALEWGVGSKSSYDRARKELVNKKYLVETNQKDYYNFYELPQCYIKDEYNKKLSNNFTVKIN